MLVYWFGFFGQLVNANLHVWKMSIRKFAYYICIIHINSSSQVTTFDRTKARKNAVKPVANWGKLVYFELNLCVYRVSDTNCYKLHCDRAVKRILVLFYQWHRSLNSLDAKLLDFSAWSIKSCGKNKTLTEKNWK